MRCAFLAPIVAGLIWAGAALAQTGPIRPLNCTDPDNAAERTVCSDGGLLAKHDALVVAWAAAPPSVEYVRDWRRNRNRCRTNKDCLNAVYAWSSPTVAAETDVAGAASTEVTAPSPLVTTDVAPTPDAAEPEAAPEAAVRETIAHGCVKQAGSDDRYDCETQKGRFTDCSGSAGGLSTLPEVQCTRFSDGVYAIVDTRTGQIVPQTTAPEAPRDESIILLVVGAIALVGFLAFFVAPIAIATHIYSKYGRPVLMNANSFLSVLGAILFFGGIAGLAGSFLVGSSDASQAGGVVGTLALVGAALVTGLASLWLACRNNGRDTSARAGIAATYAQAAFWPVLFWAILAFRAQHNREQRR